MKALKCSKCGFVGFGDAGFCKRCGWSLELNDETTLVTAQVEKPRRALRFKLKLAFGVFAIAAIAAGIVVAHFKLTKYFDKTPLYLAAITNSEKFKMPITVRVNRRQLPTGEMGQEFFGRRNTAGSAVKSAYVLEAIGLLTMSIETSVRTVSVINQPSLAEFDFSGRMIRGPGSMTKLVDVESDRLVIELTESGRQEALNWKEADERIKTSAGEFVLPFWIIPVGEREIVRIESATPAPADSDIETLQVIFRWRWRPNKMGQNFDPYSPSFNSLPVKAQLAAKNLALNSRDEYSGHARLRKLYGRWECVDIIFVDEMVRGVRGD